MTLDDAIEFIVAKFELIAAHALTESDRLNFRRMAEDMDSVWNHPRLSMAQLRTADGEMLERLLNHHVSGADAATIRQQLVARFRTSRLRAPDRKVARRVLSSGAIFNLEEYYQVQEFVSCIDNIEVIGEKNYGILEGLLHAFEPPDESLPEPISIPPANSKPSRRRPPPPFDLILVDDERLCPPDTPTEVRLAFLHAKFALVIDATPSPRVRVSLASSSKNALGAYMGNANSDAARHAALEWKEHEAEYFCVYQVSGATHRAIEVELEKQFGFRRLGPTAQERLRRLLQTNNPLDRGSRLFIERFIYNYPHQTLFTHQELKRAQKLLKDPPPPPGSG